MDFKLWSQVNKEVASTLKPDFGLRSWDDLQPEEKPRAWKYLESYFFVAGEKGNYNEPYADSSGKYYEFTGDQSYEKQEKRSRIALVIYVLNQRYKAKSYGRNYLSSDTYTNACRDFYEIFTTTKDRGLTIELLSLYAKALLIEKQEKNLSKKEGESDQAYVERNIEWKYENLDKFAEDLNEVFGQFGIDVYLTRTGFVPRQEDKILEDIYNPVLNIFSHPQWKEVNDHLAEAFSEYRKNTESGFSNSLTNTVTAVQAYLQLVVNGKTGSKEGIKELMLKAQAKGLIPADTFTKDVFDRIQAHMMRERQAAGPAHPRKEYANSKNARLALNLAMVFFQHCLSPE